MIGLEGKQLHSEHLTFRLLEECDRAPLFALLQDPAVTMPAGFLPPTTPEAQAAFWQGLTMYRTGVAILLQNQCIGYCHVNPYRTEDPAYREKKNVDIGIVIGSAYHRRGYGRETILTMTEYLLSRFDHVWGDSFADNIASCQLFLSCGFREYGAYDMVFEALGGQKHILSHVR